jgi:hypothetical protein
MQRGNSRPWPSTTATCRERVRAHAPRCLLALFILNWFVLWLEPWFAAVNPVRGHWGYASLLMLALATLVAGLSRRLPGQNVLLACLLLGLAGLGLPFLGLHAGIPIFQDQAGTRSLWIFPLLWITALLGCRGVARVLLRPWRDDENYGYWVLGASGVLVLLFALTLGPFATSRRLWHVAPASLTAGWYGTPWLALFGGPVVAVLSIALVTPTLINKSPLVSTIDYHPLWIWLLLKALFAAGSACSRFWAPVAICVCEVIVVAALATWDWYKGSRPQEQ